jgi:hypothetical protein
MDDAVFDQNPGEDDQTPVAFPTGMPIVVTGGQYQGDRGQVVNRRPDLRPWSVWVHLDQAGVRLVPSYRLDPG